MKNNNASTLYYEVEGNKVLCSRGDVALGYKIDYPEKYSLSKFDYETLHNNWVRALKNLSGGTIVAKSDIYIKESFDATPLPAVTYLQKATQKHFNGRKYFKHTGYIFFIYTKLDTLKNKSIINPFTFPNIKKHEEEDKEVELFLTSVEQSVDVLKGSELLSLLPMTSEELYKYRDFYFNGFQDDFFTDLIIEKDAIVAEGKTAGVFVLNNEKNFPDSLAPTVIDNNFSNRDQNYLFYEGYLDVLGLTLGCSHIYNQIVFIDEHREHLKKINQNLTNLKGARRFSPENEAGATRLDAYLKETVDDQNYHYIRGHNNIIFWADSKEEYEFHKKTISATFISKDIKPYFATNERLKETFYNSFFTNVSCLNSSSLYLVDLRIAACLFSITSNYKNDQVGIVLNDRVFNTPIIYDFWDKDRKRKESRSFSIIATTGRGKSFTANTIFNQLIPNDVTVVILDLGDSYLKMATLYDKEDVLVFKYKTGAPLGLNPFRLIEGEEVNSLKIEDISEFVWTLIKKQNIPTENERTSLRAILQYYYAITDDGYSWFSFYDFIEKNKKIICNAVDIKPEFFNLDEFLHAGRDFVGDGAYASLFREDEDVSTNFIGKKLIIFELDEIKDNQLILSIMLQVISEAIHKTVWADRSAKGIVFYDEFAKQLEFPQVLQRVKYQTQAIRKHNGAVGIVLQTLDQLPDTDIGRSILANIETHIFLEGADHRTAENRLNLSTHDKSQLYSLKNKFFGEEKYSEIYIKPSKCRGNVYRIEVAPEVFLAYQTEGDTHEAIMKLYKELGTMEKAIESYKRDI